MFRLTPPGACEALSKAETFEGAKETRLGVEEQGKTAESATCFQRHKQFIPFSSHSESEDPAADIKELQGYAIGHEMNTMFDVEKLQEKLALYKANIPLGRLFFQGVVAGWWVGLAVILVETIAGGIPIATRTDWPCLPKLVAGFFFPVAIFLIIIYGGELFTGNAMSLLVGLMARRITVFQLLYNWSVVLVSNFVGCVLTVFLFGKLTHLFEDEPWLSYTKSVTNGKINMKPEVCFLKAIPANALVCTSVILGQQARTMPGKLVSHLFVSLSQPCPPPSVVHLAETFAPC